MQSQRGALRPGCGYGGGAAVSGHASGIWRHISHRCLDALSLTDDGTDGADSTNDDDDDDDLGDDGFSDEEAPDDVDGQDSLEAAEDIVQAADVVPNTDKAARNPLGPAGIHRRKSTSLSALATQAAAGLRSARALPTSRPTQPYVQSCNAGLHVFIPPRHLNGSSMLLFRRRNEDGSVIHHSHRLISSYQSPTFSSRPFCLR